MKKKKKLKQIIAVLLCVGMAAIGCKNKKEPDNNTKKAVITEQKPADLDPANFKDTINGEEVKLYKIQNSKGMEAFFTNYGGRFVSLHPLV